MKNPAPYIRTALVTLLNETITYDGVDVPCYSGEGEDSDRFQIFLNEPTWNARNDKSSFTKRFTQPIEVVSKQETNMNTHVDAIAGEIMELLNPTPTAKVIPDSADFQVFSVEADNPNYISEPNGEGQYLNRIIINYNFFINQF
jgi:hypothetical protein